MPRGVGDAFDRDTFGADEPTEALPSLAQPWSRQPVIERRSCLNVGRARGPRILNHVKSRVAMAFRERANWS